MEFCIENINESLIKCNSQINDKIIGINYLENLKFLFLENLTNFDYSSLEKFKENLKSNNGIIGKHEFNSQSIKTSTSLYLDNLSKIKSKCEKDNLSIVLEGLKNISLFDFKQNNKNIKLSLFKKMGIALPKNTILSEKIASGSIILDIFLEKKILDIEN
tara:strand:+ start:607 stop:1086 length:480 start_codon:yes stop_codon:yes gene_type:complete